MEAITPTVLPTSGRTESSRRGELYEGPTDRRCTTHRKHAKTADTGANRKHGGKKLQRTRDSIDITPTAPPTSGRTRSFRERGSHGRSKDPRGITHEKMGIITRTLSIKAITPTVPPASRRTESSRRRGSHEGPTNEKWITHKKRAKTIDTRATRKSGGHANSPSDFRKGTRITRKVNGPKRITR